MEHKVAFVPGYDCIKFECLWGHRDCAPGSGGSHGKGGLKIHFVTKGDLGAIEFILGTGWYPQFAIPSNIETRYCEWGGEAYPYTIGYHSKTPMYDDHEVSAMKCEYLDGKPCYSGESNLRSYDAMYALVNGGEEALWGFLDAYYEHMFRGAANPQPAEYTMSPRARK